jgi:hypothetical protein
MKMVTFGEEYAGTKQDADNEGIKVAKKAETVSSGDAEDAFGWKKDGYMYSAYEEKEEPTERAWEPLYEEPENEIQKKVYFKLKTDNDIVQVEEGQRTQTNEKIKKIFLNNKYFKYDGSQETAEVIEKLREAIPDYSYGNLNDKNYEGVTVDVSRTSENGEYTKTYKAKDYIGTADINQKSLSAFSMLENTHTLDADYIYRDFKELIVELGYFDKEDLAETTPRVFQWFIPEIGSGGYPIRALDKNENEIGTFAHSKGDYEANKQNTLVEMYKKAAEDRENDPFDNEIEAGDVETQENVAGLKLNNGSSKINNNVGSINQGNSTANIEQIVGSMGGNFERIPESGDGYKSKVKTGSVEYTHYYQLISGGGSYAEKTFYWSGQEKTISQAGCGPTSCINILTGYGYDVNPTKDIVGIHFNATTPGVKEFMEEHGVPGQAYTNESDAEYIRLIEEAFSQGRPVIALMHADKTGDTFWTSGGHFVAIAGQDSSGNIITLDPASVGRADRETYTGGVSGLMSMLTSVWIADKAPDGSSMGSSYEGYEGGEAVVAPATGILLEYGTYDSSEEEKDERTNVDLKYAGRNNQNEENIQDPPQIEEETNPEETEPQEEFNKVVDKVGYAKILVLDQESYLKLEAFMKSNAGEAMKDVDDDTYVRDDGTFVDSKNLFEENSLENWSDQDKTLYGYKEFAQLYENFNLSGNIIYLDGFKCELPNTESEEETEGETPEETESEEEALGSGVELSMDYFKSNAESYEETLYEPAERYRLTSQKSTNKLNNEEDTKTDAVPLIYLQNEDMLFIKEGTVIGRTISDKELLEDPQYRNGQYGTYEEIRGSSENETEDETETEDEENENSQVIGNYIRITMLNSKDTSEDTHVENVEDYLKLDEEGNGSVVADDVIKFMAGVLTAECGPTSEEGQVAAAWVIKNRLDKGTFGASLAEILVAPLQFVVVATSPEECTGGYVTQGETISLEVNGTMYYVNAPSEQAIKVAQSVMSGNSEYANPIADRCYWKSAGTNVDSSKDPIQIPPGTGNKFHY